MPTPLITSVCICVPDFNHLIKPTETELMAYTNHLISYVVNVKKNIAHQHENHILTAQHGGECRMVCLLWDGLQLPWDHQIPGHINRTYRKNAPAISTGQIRVLTLIFLKSCEGDLNQGIQTKHTREMDHSKYLHQEKGHIHYT